MYTSGLPRLLGMADRIAKQFDGKVLERNEAVAEIRRCWVEIIAESMDNLRHLMAGAFTTKRGSITRIVGGHGSAVIGNEAAIYLTVDDQTRLFVHFLNKKPWRVRWEKIDQIQFSYQAYSLSGSSPTPYSTAARLPK